MKEKENQRRKNKSCLTMRYLDDEPQSETAGKKMGVENAVPAMPTCRTTSQPTTYLKAVLGISMVSCVWISGEMLRVAAETGGDVPRALCCAPCLIVASDGASATVKAVKVAECTTGPPPNLP